MNDNNTADDLIRNYVSNSRTFDDEQEVVTKSWHLPTATVERLRDFIVGRFGTTQHIGSFVSRAMRNWIEDDPTDEVHKTWERFKNDYDWSDVDAPIDEWNYRMFQDYSGLTKDDKTALGFSAPVSVIDAFTENLNKNDYGVTLANAVESELLKRAQVEMMKELIADEDIERTQSEVVHETPDKVPADNDTDDLSDITIDDLLELPDAEVGDFAASHDVGWKNRRGLLAATIRNKEKARKNTVYSNDEMMFGTDSPRSKRKDLKAIVEAAQNDRDALSLAPAKKVMDELDDKVAVNLPQRAGLTARRQPISFEYEDVRPMKYIFFNAEKKDEMEMWEEFGGCVCDFGHVLSEVEWNKGDSVTIVYAGKHYLDALDDFIPFIRAVETVAADEIGTDNHVHSRIASVIDQLESALEEVQSFSRRGKSIPDLYDGFVEQGKTPKSLEFKKGGETTGLMVAW